MTETQFQVLQSLVGGGPSSQRDIAEKTGLSLGTVNATYRILIEEGLCRDFAVTDAGYKALAPYKIDNAVIMAAGLSSRFAPISYEKPKGLLQVRGDVLIERQIRQLQEAEITDITVVVGYKQEYFLYLEDAFSVKIVVNTEFASRNNNSSLMAVVDRLKNTLICSADIYYTRNPFTSYAYRAFYCSEFRSGATKEWCLGLGASHKITSVTVGGFDAWVMIGHAYFDRKFSESFSRILKDEYDHPSTADKLWEDLFVDHIKDLDMAMQPFEEGIIFEFDTLDEVRQFDPDFILNVDSEAFDNIVDVLGCTRNEIHDVYPLKQGLTNLSCHFSVGDAEYVYRHPGAGTEQMIDRNGEVVAQHLAKRLGLDGTFVFEDPEKGWKISRFIPNCRPLDPKNPDHVKRAMKMARKLHGKDIRVEKEFDFYSEGKKYEKLLLQKGPIDVPGYYDLAEKARQVNEIANRTGRRTCLTHNDFFMLNFLLDEQDSLHLIDWEYAGMSDYASDFGTFVVCCQLSEAEAEKALSLYFGRTPTPMEVSHNYSYIALAGWCWYIWSLFKETEGECVGEWLYIYYRYAKEYLDKVLAMDEVGSVVAV